MSTAILVSALAVGATQSASVSAYEEPDFEVLASHEAFEVRQYQDYLVAETRVDSSFGRAGNEAFDRLGGYIFGNNATGQKIDMTTPVAQVPDEGSYRITFMMPTEHSLESLPAPKDARVQIRVQEGQLMAVRRYSGLWNQRLYLRQEAILRKAVAEAGYEVIGKPVFARYNTPWSLWFVRRNEILLPIAAAADLALESSVSLVR